MARGWSRDRWESYMRDNVMPPAIVDYIIYQEGGKVKAKNGYTGKIDFRDVDAGTVVQEVFDEIYGIGTVFFKKGSYQLHGIKATGKCISMYGESPSMVEIIQTPNTDDGLFYIDTTGLPSEFSERFQLPKIVGFKFDGHLGNGTRGHLLELHDYRDVEILYNWFNNSNGSAIYLDTTHDAHIQGNAVERTKGLNPDGSIAGGIHITEGYSNWIYNNFFYDMGSNAPVIRHMGANNGIKVWILCNMISYRGGTHGLDIEKGYQYIIGNYIEESYGHGIWSSGKMAVIKNNTIINPSQGSANSYDAINLDAYYGNIVGGVIRDNWIYDDSSKMRHGIYLYEPSSYTITAVKVRDNTIQGSVSDAIASDTTDVEISHNYGWKTENHGTFTDSGDGTKTQFTIAHGLVAEPSKVHVEPMTSDADGDFYITKDATNIYVNYNTAPASGTDNVVLLWEAEV